MMVIFAKVFSCQHRKKSERKYQSIIFDNREKYDLLLKKMNGDKVEYLPKIYIKTNESLILESEHSLILFFGCHQNEFSELLYIYNENNLKLYMLFSPIKKFKIMALKIGVVTILLYFLLVNSLGNSIPKYSKNIGISVGFFAGAMTLMINLSRYYRLDNPEDKLLIEEQDILKKIFELTTRKQANLNKFGDQSMQIDLNHEEKEVIVNRLITSYDEIVSLLFMEIEMIRGGSQIQESFKENISKKISNLENFEKQISEFSVFRQSS